jgi:hypothetical protein
MNFRLMTTLLSLTLGYTLLHGAAQAGFEEAVAAYKKKDFATAMSELQPLAAKGDAAAQYNLGVMHEHGQGTAQDAKEALRWYRLAAEQGHFRAQFNLGLMYASGKGAAKDDKEAAKWYRKAAERGDARSQFNLGLMHANGEGVAKNEKEAARWIRLAAEQDDARAQSRLAGMYTTGQGVKPDRVVAYALLGLSAVNNPSPDNPSIASRAELEKFMTPQEIDAAKALTVEMSKPGNVGPALDTYLMKPVAREKGASTSRINK